MYYLRSRYYYPNLNRFVNADILLTRNIYQYCKSNPCSKVDPNGLFAEEEDWSFFDQPGIEVEIYTPPVASQAEMYFTMYYLPCIMSFLNDPADYSYPYKGGSGIPIDCSHLMQAITGHGSEMARMRYSRYPGSKGALFKNGELAVELVVGMEVFKPSVRTNSDGTRENVENGHVGMLIKFDFGDGEGEVWAVFQSVSGGVSKSQALYPAGTDPDFGPNITKFYSKNGACDWKNYTAPWYYFDPLYTGGN